MNTFILPARLLCQLFARLGVSDLRYQALDCQIAVLDFQHLV
ncbi:MAG: hypothetical protein PUE17_00190 [Bacteroidales bacterium]|nr:hypothetical protein [Bacteroidales bacterium]MDY4558125.1 hypothetical protein [Alloprevotella sp.]